MKRNVFITDTKQTVETVGIIVMELLPKWRNEGAAFVKMIGAADRNNLRLIGKRLYNFCRKNIAYKHDPNGIEYIRSPRTTWADRTVGVDCEDYVIFIGAVSEYQDSTENQSILFVQISEQKAKNAIKGDTPIRRAKDFAKYNYLLAYGADDVDVNADIPRNRGFMITAGTAKAGDATSMDREKQLKLLKLKIKIAVAVAKVKIKLQQAA